MGATVERRVGAGAIVALLTGMACVVLAASPASASPPTRDTHRYTGPEVDIPDDSEPSPNNPGAWVAAEVEVHQSGYVSDLNFRIGGTNCGNGAYVPGIEHSYVNDLQIRLESPEGRVVSLANRIGSGLNNTGADFCGTVLNDDLFYQSIQDQTAFSAPYNSVYTSDGGLHHFDGQRASGTWTLRVRDWAPEDTGIIRAFSLDLSTRPKCHNRLVTVDLGAGDRPTLEDDVILGTPGNDTINAGWGDDTICAMGGNDTVNGGLGNDRTFAGNGHDTVRGDQDRDLLLGEAGNDHLFGGDGPDTLDGGLGNDDCNGGPGTHDTASDSCDHVVGIP